MTFPVSIKCDILFFFQNVLKIKVSHIEQLMCMYTDLLFFVHKLVDINVYATSINKQFYSRLTDN